MKTPVRIRHLALVLGSYAFALVGAHAFAGTDGVDTSSGHLWSQISGDTYDQRDHFSKGVDKMSAKLDEQLSELRAKRVGMKTDTDDWDFAIKEVEECRVLLADRRNMAAKATTPEVWADAKEKIHEAWHRSQLAVDKMNSARTS
jgi:hypothetical protein